MKCPLCNTEERITVNKMILKGSKLYRRMEFSCMNKNCENFRKTLRAEDTEIEVEEIPDEE